MTTTHVNTRVQKHRNTLRQAGFRPVQIWVPDSRHPRVIEECQRQSQLVSLSDAKDRDPQDFIENSPSDIDGWTA